MMSIASILSSENHMKSIEGSLCHKNCWCKLLQWCWSKLLHWWQHLFYEYLLQFSHSSNNPRDDIATEAYEDELDMGRSGSYLNSSINSAWSEHSLDPEDIRVYITHLNSIYFQEQHFFLQVNSELHPFDFFCRYQLKHASLGLSMIVVSGHVKSHGKYSLVWREAALLVVVEVILEAKEEESSTARAVYQFT